MSDNGQGSGAYCYSCQTWHYGDHAKFAMSIDEWREWGKWGDKQREAAVRAAGMLAQDEAKELLSRA